MKEIIMFEIHSSAFEEGQPIPARYTCEGDDISPPLAWSGAPEGTKSYALLVDDPDAPDPAAPRRLYLHWIRFGIPASVTELREGAGNDAPSEGAQDLRNDGSVRLVRALPAHRAAPLLLSFICAGHDADGLGRGSHPKRVRARH
jgi:phosphatidylethanolamine-binding protein (PEBP) family uncharacterized protein